jgi:hypothetical protein
MKKLLFFLSLLAMVFVSCSDDSEEEGENLLKKKIEHDFFGESPDLVSRYNYNGNKLENIVRSDGKNLIYAYDGDLIVNIKTYDDVELLFEEQFQYDETGRLIQSKRFEYVLGHATRKTYTYNADLTVTETAYIGSVAAQNELWLTNTLHYENGQVKTMESDYAEAPDGIYTFVYTYDDRLVPESNILGFDRINLAQPGAVMHNVTWVEQTDTESDFVGTFGYDYHYNENGMPVYFQYNDTGTIIIDGGSVEYFYN